MGVQGSELWSRCRTLHEGCERELSFVAASMAQGKGRPDV